MVGGAPPQNCNSTRSICALRARWLVRVCWGGEKCSGGMSRPSRLSKQAVRMPSKWTADVVQIIYSVSYFFFAAARRALLLFGQPALTELRPLSTAGGAHGSQARRVGHRCRGVLPLLATSVDSSNLQP